MDCYGRKIPQYSIAELFLRNVEPNRGRSLLLWPVVGSLWEGYCKDETLLVVVEGATVLPALRDNYRLTRLHDVLRPIGVVDSSRALEHEADLLAMAVDFSGRVAALAFFELEKRHAHVVPEH